MSRTFKDIVTTHISEIKVGMRMRETIAGGFEKGIITVTGFTDLGFTYRLDAPRFVHSEDLGVLTVPIDGGEVFAIDGEVFYEPESPEQAGLTH